MEDRNGIVNFFKQFGVNIILNKKLNVSKKI